MGKRRKYPRLGEMEKFTQHVRCDVNTCEFRAQKKVRIQNTEMRGDDTIHLFCNTHAKLAWERRFNNLFSNPMIERD